MEKKFIWLADDCFSRRGSKLERGKSYREEDFPEGSVEVWVKEGKAKWAKEKKENKESGGE